MADSSLDHRPQAISVVMSGAAEPSGRHLQGHIDTNYGIENWTTWDLRTMLTDPVNTEQVHWKDDGTVITTIQAIYCQHNCAEVALDIVKKVTNGYSSRLIDLFDRTGHHRADTIGRTVVELLNGLVEPNGNRVYNAQCFPLAHITKERALQGAINAAVQWVNENGWTDMLGGERDPSLVYGYDAATKRKDAMATFQTMWSWVETHNQAVRDSGVAADPNTADEAATEWVRDARAAWEPRSVDDWRGGDRAHGSRWSDGWADHDQSRGWSGDDRDAGTSWKHARSASPPAPSAATNEEPLESWMRIGTCDARVWLDELTSRNVDTCAQQELVLLSQHSHRGHGMANSILAKLLKKESDGVEFNNVSGFIHTAVKNKRDILGWD